MTDRVVQRMVTDTGPYPEEFGGLDEPSRRRRHGRTRSTWLTGAMVAVSMLGACSDDGNAPSNEPGGGEVEDNPEGVTGGGSTIVDADVPVSNVGIEEEAPLDPAEPAST
jgi:hypothetical protein